MHDAPDDTDDDAPKIEQYAYTGDTVATETVLTFSDREYIIVSKPGKPKHEVYARAPGATHPDERLAPDPVTFPAGGDGDGA